MKILVTGGAGFIGSHVVDAYLAAGHDVVVVDNLSTGHEENVSPLARLHRVDLRDKALEDVFAAEQPAVVSHHAAQASVNGSIKDPLNDASINILGSLNLIRCALRFGVAKLIYISSSGAIFGEPRYLPVDEQHPVSPLSPYGASKHTVEHYLELYRAAFGLAYTVLRYSNVYGPRQDPFGEAGVVAKFTRQMLAGERPTVNGTGEQQRDMLYVSDVAAANIAALEMGANEAYNLGSGSAATVNDIFASLARLAGYPHPARRGPALPGEVFKIYADHAKATRDLGWRPAVGLEEGLARTVEYFRAR